MVDSVKSKDIVIRCWQDMRLLTSIENGCLKYSREIRSLHYVLAIFYRNEKGICDVILVGTRSNPWKQKMTPIEAKVFPLLEVFAGPRCCFIAGSRGRIQHPHRVRLRSRMVRQLSSSCLASIRIELLWFSAFSWRPLGWGPHGPAVVGQRYKPELGRLGGNLCTALESNGPSTIPGGSYATTIFRIRTFPFP